MRVLDTRYRSRVLSIRPAMARYAGRGGRDTWLWSIRARRRPYTFWRWPGISLSEHRAALLPIGDSAMLRRRAESAEAALLSERDRLTAAQAAPAPPHAAGPTEVAPAGVWARLGRWRTRMGDEAARRPPFERAYGPLADHLAACAAAGERRVTLAFATIEGALLGRPLPGTARHRQRHGRWWKGWGGPTPHAWYGWQRAGWHVETIDLDAEMVTFARPGAAGR